MNNNLNDNKHNKVKLFLKSVLLRYGCDILFMFYEEKFMGTLYASVSYLKLQATVL